MKSATTFVVAFLLLVQAAQAQVTYLRSQAEAVCQVFQFTGGNTYNSGTGTLIERKGKRGLIVTNHHVTPNEDNLTRVRFTNLSTGNMVEYTAKVIHTDKKYDLAFLTTVNLPDSVDPLRLAERNGFASRGENVQVMGFGGGQFRVWNSQVEGYSPTKETGFNHNVMLAPNSIAGDSGSPVLFNNRVVGVIWGKQPYYRNQTDAAFRQNVVWKSEGSCIVPISDIVNDQLGDWSFTTNVGFPQLSSVNPKPSGKGSTDDRFAKQTGGRSRSSSAPAVNVDLTQAINNAVNQAILDLDIGGIIDDAMPSAEEIAQSVYDQYGDQLKVDPQEIMDAMPSAEDIAQSVYDQYGDQLKAPPADLTSLEEAIAKLQDCCNKQEPTPVEPVDNGNTEEKPDCSQYESQIKQLNAAIAVLEQRLDREEEKDIKGDSDTFLVIYLTASNCPHCADTDSRVERMVQDGYNIRRVILKPSEVDVANLPRLTVFPGGRNIRGKDDVEVYLSTLVK